MIEEKRGANLIFLCHFQPLRNIERYLFEVNVILVAQDTTSRLLNGFYPYLGMSISLNFNRIDFLLSFYWFFTDIQWIIARIVYHPSITYGTDQPRELATHERVPESLWNWINFSQNDVLYSLNVKYQLLHVLALCRRNVKAWKFSFFCFKLDFYYGLTWGKVRWSLLGIFYVILTLSWRRQWSYRPQSTDLLWFLYDNGLRHERVNPSGNIIKIKTPENKKN